MKGRVKRRGEKVLFLMTLAVGRFQPCKPFDFVSKHYSTSSLDSSTGRIVVRLISSSAKLDFTSSTPG